ncbi:hypothetical protein BH10ACI4_BH10ACI4_33510 [soil metagenome]
MGRAFSRRGVGYLAVGFVLGNIYIWRLKGKPSGAKCPPFDFLLCWFAYGEPAKEKKY